MRIAAGVILIIVALANLAGGSIYALGGAAVAGSAEYAKDVNNDAKKEKMADEKQHKENAENIGDAQKAGGALAGVGFYLLILGSLEIAAAVLLFMGKKANFIRGVCVGEFIGIGAVAGVIAAPGLFSIVGGVGAILGLVASGSIAKAEA